MKIQSKNKQVVSCKLIVPIDGLIEVDAEGIADVSPKCAAVLVNQTNDWEYAVKGETTTEEQPANEGTTAAPADKTEREILEEKLKTAKKSELEEMCKEGGFPAEEWKDLSKALLAAYILKKYDEADEEDDDDTPKE